LSEPFPIRMDHFERRLEIALAHLLDPIVDARVPRRRRPGGLKALSGGLSGLPADTVILAEALPVPVPVPATLANPS
jgi:hypothetical protein